jgi:hypothetical protein
MNQEQPRQPYATPALESHGGYALVTGGSGFPIQDTLFEEDYLEGMEDQ